MPIYAYKCSACGFAKDQLQKMSDPPLTVCPECGQETFSKQVTAAGFQLKGSGWYVTDFRNNGSAAKDGSTAKAASGDAPAAAATEAKPAAPASSPTGGAGASTPSPAVAPTPGSGTANTGSGGASASGTPSAA